ncbi:BamA/TamA family outer membrane protein [Paracoccus sp. Z330]|uniref:BamA/TamA family outer membrane protein n=1 Tax=Paracoccus onchidii TaxID=3017813 RepID=A0ABT4ZFT2_9RHOB|nr:BamA/TamA family outer membrane protein [Paracoccus onchidii]MDB6178176.1 BamA/TamA family outer membrane protein [Paracoccus onchidii]
MTQHMHQRVPLGGLLAVILSFGPYQQAEAFEFSQFIDPQDGRLDASEFLEKGGFIPVPVIITEPAVDGGFGIIGQFIRNPDTPGDQPTRTMFGIARTGNESTAGGILRSGSMFDGDVRYKLGFGAADITLPIFPFGLSQPINYENMTYGLFGTARMRLGDSDFWAGPRLIYRQADLSLSSSRGLTPEFERLRDRVDDLLDVKRYAAVGASLHYDTRNNPFTPTDGVNAVLKFDAYGKAIGSDANFTNTQFAISSFADLGAKWGMGILGTVNMVDGDSPFFIAPSVDLRGVQAGRYAGDAAFSTEVEFRRQLTSRWAGVAFGGYGETTVSSSDIFEAEDGIWTYGAGIRYRIARKLGLDVGLDIAKGPEEHIVYIQFGHAWSRSMD